ncbi:unnamed protein product [Linum trigynum]|uniref:F-box domain-containing protein n=1 Tax=Linum trigynum TaxID=586398 RepID=A0AAV2C949_9ROSI
MESETRKTPLIASPVPGIGAGDRLSSLPDEIISHILSFLQTKYAVGTAVLSRRWKDLWVRVSSLDLDNCLVYKPLNREIAFRSLPMDEQQKYLYGKVPDPVSEILGRRDLEFCRFVDRVLSKHKNLDSLRRFRFHFSTLLHKRNQASPDSWFERELVFGPLLEEIDVSISGETDFGIPQCFRCIPESFYALRNLKVAKLGGFVLGAVEESVFLPSVKILQLWRVVVEDFNSLGRFLHGFPSLETAHLQFCFPSNRGEDEVLEISLPYLKNLQILDDPDVYYPDGDYGTACAIVLEAPKLEDLHFDVTSTDFDMVGGPFPCLHSAYVDIGDCESSDHLQMEVLTRISYAKEITFGQCMRHMLVTNDVQFPEFPNLTHLTMQSMCSRRVLHSLLNSATKLQSLVIYLGGDRGQPGWDRRSESYTTPKCLLSSLEEIEIKDIVEYEDDVELVAYLLEVGAVLKKVNLVLSCYGYKDTQNRKALASLLKRPRRSSSCEVRLILPNNEEFRIDSDHESDIDDHHCHVFDEEDS